MSSRKRKSAKKASRKPARKPAKKAAKKAAKKPAKKPAAKAKMPAKAVRAQPETLRARRLTVSLTANNLQASLAWYRDIVGFTVNQRYERDGMLRGVSLKAGAVDIMLNQDDGAMGVRPKGAGFSVQFVTAQSVDQLAAGIKSRGGTLATEPADMPWGARVFRLQDPDGVKLVISSERRAT